MVLSRSRARRSAAHSGGLRRARTGAALRAPLPDGAPRAPLGFCVMLEGLLRCQACLLLDVCGHRCNSVVRTRCGEVTSKAPPAASGKCLRFALTPAYLGVALVSAGGNTRNTRPSSGPSAWSAAGLAAARAREAGVASSYPREGGPAACTPRRSARQRKQGRPSRIRFGVPRPGARLSVARTSSRVEDPPRPRADHRPRDRHRPRRHAHRECSVASR